MFSPSKIVNTKYVKNYLIFTYNYLIKITSLENKIILKCRPHKTTIKNKQSKVKNVSKFKFKLIKFSNLNSIIYVLWLIN